MEENQELTDEATTLRGRVTAAIEALNGARESLWVLRGYAVEASKADLVAEIDAALGVPQDGPRAPRTGQRTSGERKRSDGASTAPETGVATERGRRPGPDTMAGRILACVESGAVSSPVMAHNLAAALNLTREQVAPLLVRLTKRGFFRKADGRGYEEAL